MSMKALPIYQEGEEFANSLTHGFAAFMSMIGGIFLIKKGMRSHDKNRIIGYIVFTLSMVELYTVSCLYHGSVDPNIKMPLRYLDHCSVYFLIAGSYTPFALITFRHCGGIKLLIVVWAIAIVGTITKLFFFDKIEKYTCIFYIAMGWLGVVMGKEAKKLFPKKGMFWLVLGGVTYTVGTYFFTVGDEKIYYHAIFHIFILLGTVFHFICIYFYT